MYSNTAALASSRVRKRTGWTCSVLSEAKTISRGAVSKQLPLQHRAIRLGGVLHAAVAVVDQPARRPMPLDGHDQGVDAQPGPEVVGHRPADDLARGHVLDRGQRQEALAGGDVRDVR